MRTHIRRYATPAHTYYADATGGNDANNGGAGAPLKTIGAVNALTFKPGDRILFKAGEVWSGTRLVLAASGRLGRPIAFGAYGAGAAPAITGDGNGAFYASSARSFYRLDGLDLRGGTYAVNIEGHDVVVQNCNIQDATATGLLLFATSTIYNVCILGCTIHNNAQSGIEAGADTLPGPANLQIGRVASYSNGTTVNHHGVYVKRANNVLIQDCNCYSNAGHGVNTRLYATNILVDRCYLHENGSQGIYSDTVSAGCNIVWRNLLSYLNTANGGYLGDNAVGVSVLHCTFVRNVLYAFGAEYATSLGNNIQGNIFFLDTANSSRTGPVRCQVAGNVSGNVWNYNLAYMKGAGTQKWANVGGTTYDLAGWQALTGTPDLNSVDGDPLFTAEFTSMVPGVGSPALGAGLAGLVPYDYVGVPRGTPPDIGAYEA